MNIIKTNRLSAFLFVAVILIGLCVSALLTYAYTYSSDTAMQHTSFTFSGVNVYASPYEGAPIKCMIPPFKQFIVTNYPTCGQDLGWQTVEWGECRGVAYRP
jgi:hypothetical protein